VYNHKYNLTGTANRNYIEIQ